MIGLQSLATQHHNHEQDFCVEAWKQALAEEVRICRQKRRSRLARWFRDFLTGFEKVPGRRWKM